MSLVRAALTKRCSKSEASASSSITSSESKESLSQLIRGSFASCDCRLPERNFLFHFFDLGDRPAHCKVYFRDVFLVAGTAEANATAPVLSGYISSTNSLQQIFSM